jgi:hypothetical protein
MRRLTAHQPVSVTIDDERDGIDAAVEAVVGPIAALVPTRPVAPPIQSRLDPGALGWMAFEHRGAAVGLRGLVRSAIEQPKVEFIVVDGVQIAERRGGMRIPLIAPVRVTMLDGTAEHTIATVTSNLSIGGVMLARRPGLAKGHSCRLELRLPSDPSPLSVGGTVARATPTHFGIAFADLTEIDRLRVAACLAKRIAPA